MMKKIVVVLIVFGCSLGLRGQTDSISLDSFVCGLPMSEIQTPEYPGGENSLLKFVKKNLKFQPITIEQCIKGTVKVAFMVEKDGSVTDIEIVSKILGDGIEEEVIRVIKLLSNFKPAMQNGQPVRFRMVVPIKIKLQ